MLLWLRHQLLNLHQLVRLWHSLLNLHQGRCQWLCCGSSLPNLHSRSPARKNAGGALFREGLPRTVAGAAMAAVWPSMHWWGSGVLRLLPTNPQQGAGVLLLLSMPWHCHSTLHLT